jgi:hypothetical protein
MTTLELNTLKLGFVKEFLSETNENLINKQIDSCWTEKYTAGGIPGMPRTVEELNASVQRAEKEYEDGLSFTHEEVFKKYKQWL